MKTAIYFNPFTRYTEKVLLIVGIASALSGGLLAGFLDVVFDGVIDLHISNYAVTESIFFNFLQIGIMSVFLFSAALIVNVKTRFVDILNVAFFYRIPFYITIFFVNIQSYKNAVQTIARPEDIKKISGAGMAALLSVSVVSLLFLIWSMIILVNGFRVASNARKTWHFGVLAIFVLLAEVLSKYIFFKIIA